VFAENRRVKLLTLATCCFGLFMVLLDNTIVNVALPSMQRDLGASVSGLQLVVDAYLLVFASLLLTAGALGDRFGRKRTFLAGLVVFTTGSAVCGLAPNLATLVGARAVQAVGAAALLPSTLAIIAATFPDPRERAQAIGLWSGMSGVALTAGPVLGGVLTDGFGWPSVFYANVPVGVAAFLVARRTFAESRNPVARRLDLPGQLIGVVTLGSLTFGLIEGGARGWGSPLIVALLAVAAVGLAAFLAVESRRAEPMLDLRFFRDPSFAGANAVSLLIGFALLGFVFFNTLYLQVVQGYTPARAGLATLPNTLSFVVVAPIAGRLASRFGYRVPVVAGTLCAGAALLLLAGVEVDTSYARLWWQFALLGTGLGLAISPTTAAAVAGMPSGQAGVASAVTTTGRQVGGALGIAVLGAVVASRFAAALPGRLAHLNLPPAARERLQHEAVRGVAAAVPGGGAVRRAVATAFVTGIQAGYLVAGIALLCGAVVALAFLRPGRDAAGTGPALTEEPTAGRT